MSSLNVAILHSVWGRLKEFSAYRAQGAGKPSVPVPAQHTAKACAACGHTHAD